MTIANGLMRSDFPAAFRWGCATSAYQIEGAASIDGRGESIWDRFCTQPGRIRDGSSGAVACDHYHRWPADLQLAADLGLNAYRFSIAWPRLFPSGRERAPHTKGLDFYSRLVDGMLERGLEPWATLYHWDLPQGLQDGGGWAARDTAAAFAGYAHAVAGALGDRVRHWITHNEPWCTAFLGHYEGVHAPGLRDWRTALHACHHVLLSHGLAVTAIRGAARAPRVGIALSLHPLEPASPSVEDRHATHRYDALRNCWFLDPLYGRGYPADVWELCGSEVPQVLPGDLGAIAAPTDFLGINYYFPELISHAPGHGPLSARVLAPHDRELTDLGWEVSPSGMVALLERVARDYRPSELYITENGSSYHDLVDSDGAVHDPKRRDYLVRHVTALREAITRGIPVRGYFAWTLLDNFEWAEGYTHRFGLHYVDFATQSRRTKLSGTWYRDFLNGG
ncbi:MAG TPA: GH1 family beta-glucosidase [Steroidobacteraceae bacterium]|jgi:beta-glucosidase|nr:GH1 family beta-glucosidase [Steroidobacteraceae bacterium]